MNTEEPTPDSTDGRLPSEAAPVEHYEICVRGRLATRWETWFDGLAFSHEEAGTTTIRGPVADQAALHGLLQRLRDLGIPLLSLTRTSPDDAIEHPISPTTAHRTTTPGASS